MNPTITRNGLLAIIKDESLGLYERWDAMMDYESYAADDSREKHSDEYMFQQLKEFIKNLKRVN
jgi:hypothetical protein